MCLCCVQTLRSFIQQISFVSHNMLSMLFQSLRLYRMPGQPKLQPSHSAAEPPQVASGSSWPCPNLPYPCPQPAFEVLFFHGLSQVLPNLASNLAGALSWWLFHRLEKSKQCLLSSRESRFPRRNNGDWKDSSQRGRMNRAELQGLIRPLRLSFDLEEINPVCYFPRTKPRFIETCCS